MSNTEKEPTAGTSESDKLGNGSSVAMLNEMLSDPLEDSMVIDFSGKENELDSLVEPLEDIAENESTNVKSEEKKSVETASNRWQAVFSTEEEVAHQQQIAASISRDSTHSSEQTIVSLDDKDISNLLKGELLEPQTLRPVTPNDGQAVPSSSAFAAEADLIYRVMSCLHHVERDRKVTVQAEKIVQECQFHHGRGDKRYQNLARSIFDRLVQLLGAPKFNEIYHRAHYVHPRGPPPPQPRYPPRFPPVEMQHCNKYGPSNIELAIAYGIHIARSTNGSEPTSEVVQHGMAALNSMTPKERVMFWNYMTKQGP